MNWIQLLLSISLLIIQKPTAVKSKEIETNDINSNTNLDSDQLRKALLKALTELENEGQSNNDDANNEDEEINSKTIFYSTTARSEESDRIVEKASASAISFFTKEKVDASTEKLKEGSSDIRIFRKGEAENSGVSIFAESSNEKEKSNSEVKIFTNEDSSNGAKASSVRIFARNGGFSATTENLLGGSFTPEGFKKSVKYTQENKSVKDSDFDQGNEDEKLVVSKKVTKEGKIAKTEDEESKSTTQKPLVIIQRSSGIQQRPIISVLNEREESDEGFLASASGGNNFVNQKNYVSKNSENFITKSSSDKNAFTSGIKTVSITPKPDSSSTTFTPSTSTEESEAKAEDVQFFSAPLVAAFTVHQDERGLPKKVEPIYKTTATVPPSLQKQELSQQLDLHEKQKLLEQEILKLQQQRSQHELLLRQIQQQSFANQGKQSFANQEQQTFANQGQQSLANQGQQSLINAKQNFEQQKQQNFVNVAKSQQQTFLGGNQFQQQQHNFGSQTERPFIPIANPVQSTLQGLTGSQFFATTPNPNFNNQFFNQQNFANQVSITKSQQPQIFPNNQQNFQVTSGQNLANQVFNSQISTNHASQLQNSNLANQISITNPPPITNNLLNQNQFLSNNQNFVENKNNFNQNPKTNHFSNLNQIVPSVQLNQNNFESNKQFGQNFLDGKNHFNQNFDNKQKNSNFLNQNGFSPVKKFNTLVSLQPSLTVNPTASTSPFSSSSLPLNAQIPPIKNAVDFRPTTNHFLTAPLIPPQENTFGKSLLQDNNFGKSLLQDNNFGKILSPPPQQQDLSFGKFQNQNNFIQNLPNIQSTRVFRQEQHTGNLGLNNQFNSFNSPNAQNFALANNNNQFNQNFGFNNNQFNNNFQPNRFFRSNQNQEGFHSARNHHHQQNVNQHLNNLLYHSGITRNNRQNDDLSIVSKILSYNVGRDNLFSGSRNSEQRIVPKVK